MWGRWLFSGCSYVEGRWRSFEESLNWRNWAAKTASFSRARNKFRARPMSASNIEGRDDCLKFTNKATKPDKRKEESLLYKWGLRALYPFFAKPGEFFLPLVFILKLTSSLNFT